MLIRVYGLRTEWFFDTASKKGWIVDFDTKSWEYTPLRPVKFSTLKYLKRQGQRRTEIYTWPSWAKPQVDGCL